jgi:hypothetical protein
MQVIAVPDAEMPAGYEWLLIEQGAEVTACVAQSALGRKQLAEVVQAIRRRPCKTG